MTKKSIIFLTASLLFVSIKSMAGFKIPDYEMTKISKAPTQKFDAVKISDSIFKDKVTSITNEIFGLDDIIIQEAQDRAIIFAMDHTVKTVNLNTKEVSEIVRLPVMPAGATEVPGSPDEILFCATRGHLKEYSKYPPIGVYHLNLKTEKLQLVFSRVPKLQKRLNYGYVPNVTDRLSLLKNKMTSNNSRALQHCNDLAITSDGKRIYITEPFDTIGSTDGGPLSQEEVFLLRRNGMIWKVDLETTKVSLVAQNLQFPDGILVKTKENDEVDDTLIISELAQYRILELNFFLNSSLVKPLIEGLPGSPDGLTWDKNGNIWIAFVKERTKILNIAHRFPALKKLLLALPEEIKPVPKKTGLMKISRAGNPLSYYMHDGSLMTDIAAVTPAYNGVFLSTYNEKIPGLFYLETEN